MTAKNFRVNNGLETGDVTITASSNAVTGVSSITLATQLRLLETPYWLIKNMLMIN